jgi:hypothetical protein
LKDVHGVANIIEEDVVECLTWPECLLELVCIWESDSEIEGWVPLLRDFHHLGANIDAFPITWSDGSQKVAGVTTNR